MIVLEEMRSNKERYEKLCQSEPTIPINSTGWWLDAVCGNDNWNVVLEEREGEIVGSLPYHFRRKLGTTLITMPQLTQTMGPWIRYPGPQKYNRRLSYENDVISALIDALPAHDHFEQRLHHSHTNWLPYYWKGFDQTTRYTYIISNNANIEEVWRECRSDVQKRITKAQRDVEIVTSNDIRKFYEVNSAVFERQGVKVPYSFNLVKRLDSACHEHDCGQMLMAMDKNDEVRAVDYTIWDSMSAYGLMSGINPKFRSDGSFKLLCWEAIKAAIERGKDYNFGGSMLMPVEEVNRSFGAVQVPYSSVSKTAALRLRIWQSMQQLAAPRDRK